MWLSLSAISRLKGAAACVVRVRRVNERGRALWEAISQLRMTSQKFGLKSQGARGVPSPSTAPELRPGLVCAPYTNGLM